VHLDRPPQKLHRRTILPAWVTALLAVLPACGVMELPRPPRSEPTGPVIEPTSPPQGTPPGSGGQPGPGASSGGGGTGGVAPSSGNGGAGGRSQPPPASDGPVSMEAASPPPASGVSVMINGTAVPREKAIVILHLGHSNMAGRATRPEELKPYFYGTDPHLWRYQQGGVWTPAKEWLCPDGGPDKSFPQGAGPGMALLRVALEAAPDAHIISIGSGQSLEVGASCFAFRKGGIHHPKMIGPALELKGKVTFGGLFVMLGYDGRTNPMAQNDGYIKCLKGLAQDFRDELEAPDLPFIAGDYERGATGGFGPTCCGAPQVIAQLARVPTDIDKAVLVPTDGIPMQDNHHYDMAGHKLWAERAFAGLIKQGLLPWATK
jgi:hypothetical protein